MPRLPDLPFVLSYTLINDYNNCPKKTWHKHIKRDIAKETKTWAQSKGTALHEALKKRLKIREPLPEEFKSLESTCNYLQDHESIKHMEIQLGMRADGSHCDFFASDVRFRGAIDLVCSNSPAAFILDYKSGKRWEDPLELRLNAVLLRARYPDLTQISGSYFWTRDAEVGRLYRLDPDDAWKSLCSTAEAMAGRLARQDWPPDDNVLCAWCPVPKGAGGPLDPVCRFRRDPP
jgi:hypothetical protein